MSKEDRTSREERIQHVVTTAKSLFIRYGYSATSTAQIAREAGISEMTLFRYFSTKRELFEAVIKPLIQIEWFPQTDSGESPEFLLLRLFHDRFRFVKQERELVRLVIIESYLQPDLAGEYNPVARVSTQLRELLARFGQDENTAQVIINLIMGVFLTILFNPLYDGQVVDTTFNIVDSQVIKLLKERG